MNILLVILSCLPSVILAVSIFVVYNKIRVDLKDALSGLFNQAVEQVERKNQDKVLDAKIKLMKRIAEEETELENKGVLVGTEE